LRLRAIIVSKPESIAETDIGITTHHEMAARICPKDGSRRLSVRLCEHKLRCCDGLPNVALGVVGNVDQKAA
jgi:hypothetical protein